MVYVAYHTIRRRGIFSRLSTMAASRRRPVVILLLAAAISTPYYSFLITKAFPTSLVHPEHEQNAARRAGNHHVGQQNSKHRRRRLTWFLHFHKAAGSSFTSLAWENNETVRHADNDETASDDPHGHLELDEQRQLRWDLVWPARPSPESCRLDPDSSFLRKLQSRVLKQEITSLQQNNITFVSTEHWFPSPKVLRQQQKEQQLTLAVLLREPMERLVSSYQFHKGGANRCPPPPLYYTNKKRHCAFSDWWQAESNMHVKMLNGIPFGPLKVGTHCARTMFSIHVTREHYSQAIETLSSFDIVLTLETLTTEPAKAACVLQRGLGWNVTKLPNLNVKRRKNSNLTIRAKDLKEAKEANVWDIHLYQHARNLEKSMVQNLGC